MADNFDDALVELARLQRKDVSSIELYRAEFATPETLEALRFWAQNELNRIQSGFASADEVIRTLSSILKRIIDNVEGGTGTQGERGPAGSRGPAGRGITVYDQSSTPAGAYPGDIWIKR